MNIIDEAYNFISTNLDNIILAFLFMLIGFIYVVLNNISFKPDKDIQHKTKKVIIYETMENMIKEGLGVEKDDDDTKITGDKCDELHGKSHNIEEYCSTLHPKLCKQKKCCILGKEGESGTMKCMAGSRLGPTYHTDEEGTDVNLDYYYYEGKCYGKDCPK